MSQTTTQPLRVLSLGAGVQSTTLALMAATAEVGPMPDCAIFADTEWEPHGVYEHLDWLETQLPFPVLSIGLEKPAIIGVQFPATLPVAEARCPGSPRE
ncbi:3'-phosphoadenosine 5'-phosphosulfate sulfotransferase (PAPS reductase)/FAD synthetase, partial [Azospirillum agricola]|nr:3'-phosphoadenosine 5'-phosphosulfate sulfotransferase (PAPS reductase)/FAD synthetase [Azospirillum agricola]